MPSASCPSCAAWWQEALLVAQSTGTCSVQGRCYVVAVVAAALPDFPGSRKDFGRRRRCQRYRRRRSLADQGTQFQFRFTQESLPGPQPPMAFRSWEACSSWGQSIYQGEQQEAKKSWKKASLSRGTLPHSTATTLVRAGLLSAGHGLRRFANFEFSVSGVMSCSE